MACSPSPLALPIGNVSLSNGGTMRGIGIGVGIPVQEFSFMPQWRNNSYVYDPRSPCLTNTTTTFCTTYHGGVYVQSASSSSQSQASVSSAGGSPGDTDFTSSQWITDDFILSASVSESSFPIGLVRNNPYQQNGPQASLGIGANSTILNVLKSTGQIASRTWSMFWGLSGAMLSDQANGTFVFGGYDSAKIVGSNYTKALTNDDRCGTGMLVTISDITLNYPNGSTTSLFDQSQSTAINACIVPSFPMLMTLPLTYYSDFEDICGALDIGRSFGVNYYTMLYEPGTLFDGDFVFSIDNQIDITIPNPQLQRPELTIDDNGRLAANYSVDDLLINSIQDVNKNDLPKLGTHFLTGAMVMTNWDANTFTLWQAGATTAPQALVAVDADGKSMQTLCDGTTTANSTMTTSSAEPGSSTLSAGAIAGIVIGVVAGLAVCAALLFFLLRRQKSKNAQAQAPSAGPDEAGMTKERIREPDQIQEHLSEMKPPSPPYNTGAQEMDISPRSPAELATGVGGRYELES